eukprot:2953777-Pyramimonas_sp.AAC.1
MTLSVFRRPVVHMSVPVLWSAKYISSLAILLSWVILMRAGVSYAFILDIVGCSITRAVQLSRTVARTHSFSIAPPTPSRSCPAKCAALVCGDFSFPARGEGSCHVSGRIVAPTTSSGKFFAQRFPFLNEVEQPKFTHGVEGFVGGKKTVDSMGRLDRIYSSMPSALLLEMSPTSGAIGLLPTRRSCPTTCPRSFLSLPLGALGAIERN